jgi:hypothetical protein
MHLAGTGSWPPATGERHRIIEFPQPEQWIAAGRGNEILSAPESGAIRGASCNYKGGIPGRGAGRPIITAGSRAELESGACEGISETIVAYLDPLQRLSGSVLDMGALAMHVIEETGSGVQSPLVTQ